MVNTDSENEFHKFARQILATLENYDTMEHRIFVQETLEKYRSVQKTKESYSQVWSAYNEAQQREKIALMNILDELLDYIPFPSQKKPTGRNPVLTRDKIFYLVMQSYNIKSSRRCIADLTIAQKLGYISKSPHFNTVLKILNDSTVTSYLKHLIQVSGLPLQPVEQDFAVDSSGFSTSMFGRWFDYKWGKQEGKERIWRKVHITCGVKTNIITAVNITTGNSGDSPQFQDLVKDTNRFFTIREVSADKAYSSYDNLQAVSDIGAIPFIPFKTNTKHKGLGIWGKMYRFFINYQEEFNHHYHKRSNVETCFHMLKRKFGCHLRSRHMEGQTNEILAKVLCHNLCVLVQEALELGIEIDFKKCANIEIAPKPN